MTYFGFMHGESIGVGGGFGVTPTVALAYAVVAIGLFVADKMGATSGASSMAPVSHSDPHLAVPAE
jgi:AGZA family xanthine/uracil permease-like MFS transporter